MTATPPVQTKPSERLRRFSQKDAYSSPWSLRTRIGAAVWNVVWCLLFRPTPKPLRPWRVMLLKLFGARIRGHIYVDASTKIRMPWNLAMEDRACLGPHTELYNLAPVILKARCTVAQHVYFCGGTHDLSSPDLPLMAGKITVGEDAFIGAKALLLPGVVIGDGAVIGAGAVVASDAPPWTICAGNPAKPIRPRKFEGRN